MSVRFDGSSNHSTVSEDLNNNSQPSTVAHRQASELDDDWTIVPEVDPEVARDHAVADMIESRLAELPEKFRQNTWREQIRGVFGRGQLTKLDQLKQAAVDIRAGRNVDREIEILRHLFAYDKDDRGKALKPVADEAVQVWETHERMRSQQKTQEHRAWLARQVANLPKY